MLLRSPTADAALVRSGLFEQATMNWLRISSALLIIFSLLLLVVGFLGLAEGGAEHPRCDLDVSEIGCLLASHQELAAGLLGAAGALFAAWLAYEAVQDQISAERNAREADRREENEQQRQRYTDAKRIAGISLMYPIRGVAALMIAIDRAMQLDAADKARQNLEEALRHLEKMLNSFAVRESVQGLGPEDAPRYLEIIGSLSSLLSISQHGATSGADRFVVQLSALRNLRRLLQAFDVHLASELLSVEPYLTSERWPS
jgi:hypothetical protein